MKRSIVLAIVGTLSLGIVVAQDTTKVIEVEQLEEGGQERPKCSPPGLSGVDQCLLRLSQHWTADYGPRDGVVERDARCSLVQESSLLRNRRQAQHHRGTERECHSFDHEAYCLESRVRLARRLASCSANRVSYISR